MTEVLPPGVHIDSKHHIVEDDIAYFVWSSTCVKCSVCSAPGSLDTSLSHAAGLIEIAACHA